MMVPSIDLMNGSAVQLVEGREKVIDAGDPRPIAEQFALVGEVAVIDLDAALGRGNNRTVIRDLLQIDGDRGVVAEISYFGFRRSIGTVRVLIVDPEEMGSGIVTSLAKPLQHSVGGSLGASFKVVSKGFLLVHIVVIVIKMSVETATFPGEHAIGDHRGCLIA